jgi:aspartate/methionine/tyrosine aminotransferase
MKAEFQARRDAMVKGLSALPGVTCPEPKGAFYCFPHFEPETWGGMGDEALALALLRDADVAATAGSAFGAHGKDHLRFSYATGQDRIREGLRRLAEYQARLPG